MKSETNSQAFLRKRKMMLVLPLLVIPFLTMAFWALGGGQGKQDLKSNQTAGLNLNLPSSNLKENNADNKLSFYEKADKDSMKLEEWMRSDPYYRDKVDTTIPNSTNELEQLTVSTASRFNQNLNTSPYQTSGNSPEQKLMEKLALLEKEMNKPASYDSEKEKKDHPIGVNDEYYDQINQLEGMMQGMNGSSAEDPGIKQLDNTLDKILDIQHPQRVKDKIKEKSLQRKEAVFTVSRIANEENISLLDTSKQKINQASGFFSTEIYDNDTKDDNAIEAVVHSNQTIVNGAIIKFRLETDIYVNGWLISRGGFVNGFASLNNERLEVEINSIRNGNSIFPVKLAVYDMDGLPGIYIPGAISRDVAKQSADNSLQLMELSTMDPSLKAQAAAAGINTAKSLLSRKVKLVKVMVKAGYKVLLKNNDEEQ